ncbi:hypothetical protein QQ045_030126 [Rhodiola kirilowii]
MTSSENDGMTLSSIERFEIPSCDEYDRDDMRNFDNDDEEGYVEVPICGEGVNNSLWDFSLFNDVSGLTSHPSIEDHNSNNSRFNMKVLKKGASKKKNEGMWRITKYEGDHTCEVDIIPHDNVHFNKHFIGMDIRELIQEKLRFSPYKVQALMRSKYGYKISYMKAWKSRQKALLHIFGDWEASFEKLPAYMDMLKESNPGSIVHWDTSMLDSGRVSLNRVFWSFAPAIEGFKHCRPVISIDATHLIGKWKGVLMIAVSLDAQNEILPLAYALVEGENIESWK